MRLGAVERLHQAVELLLWTVWVAGQRWDFRKTRVGGGSFPAQWTQRCAGPINPAQWTRNAGDKRRILGQKRTGDGQEVCSEDGRQGNDDDR